MPRSIDSSTADARSTPRRRSLLGGKLVSSTGDQSFDCVIRDLSETGARVRVSGALPLPPAPWLINIAAGVAYRTEVQWSRGDEHGLKLAERVDLKSPTPPGLMRLRLIWLECAPR